VEPDLLASAFSLVRERTVCQEADLAIEWVPTRWQCPRCETPIPAGEVLRCNRCQVPARLAAGDEIILERVEMEVP
jgi:Zn finger protein HypA/HybF involved in hydrogenase expression